MPLHSRKTISSIPDKDLSSLDQINLRAVVRAMSKDPTHRAYKTLLAHRRTLKHLQTNVDLQHEKANAELSGAMQNISKTEQTIIDATDSPNPTTRAFGMLLSILELQKLLYAEKCGALGRCAHELGRVDHLVVVVDGKVEGMERALVEKFRVRNTDDEGEMLEGWDLERAIDAKAKVSGKML